MLAGELKDPRLAVPLIVTEVRVVAGHADRARFRAARRHDDEPSGRAALDGIEGGVEATSATNWSSGCRLRRAPEVMFILDQSEEYRPPHRRTAAKVITRRNRSGTRCPGNWPARIRRYECQSDACHERHNLRRSTEFLSSTSRAEKRRTTWWNPCAGWSDSARSAIWARSIRWRPACWCWRSAAPRALRDFTPAGESVTRCAVRFGFATDTYDADGEALGPDSAPVA